MTGQPLWHHGYCLNKAPAHGVPIPLPNCLAHGVLISAAAVFTAKTLYRKFETNIPRKGIARTQCQFPLLCVCERFIYSQDRSAYSAAGKQVDRFWEYLNCPQTHECGNWDWEDPQFVFWEGIHKWDFRCSVALRLSGISLLLSQFEIGETTGKKSRIRGNHGEKSIFFLVRVSKIWKNVKAKKYCHFSSSSTYVYLQKTKPAKMRMKVLVKQFDCNTLARVMLWFEGTVF